jgi:DMSO reductase family type II enzyme heme b subunit
MIRTRFALSVAGALVVGGAPLSAQDAEAGRSVYDKWCIECHGAEGEGDGSAAAAMLPRPRDLAQAQYQIRTTGTGELPTDDDLMWVMRNGLTGTTMPGWPNLSDEEQRDVVAYIKSLSRFFGDEEPQPVDFGWDPGGGAEAIESGREVYQTLECFKCHGEAGRGDGSSAPTLEDWRGFPIRAGDLTEPWYLNGGGDVEAIHTRVLTGLDGTPMPAASDALSAGLVTPDEVWHLAHYVASLRRTDQPRSRDVVRVGRAEGPLPTDPAAVVWEDVDAFYFPLVGQVIERPRLFSPTVDGVWVQGLHDGRELTLRLTWNDPSRSPDPAWDEWQTKILATLDLDEAEIPEGRPADALAVQFPTEIPDGVDRPYFLMGDSRDPVYLWQWDSEEGVVEARATGLGTNQPLSGSVLAGRAEHTDGQWTLLVRRALESDREGRLSFREGVPIPVAFFAWDGSSGELGKRASISSWYYLFLEQPASRAVVVIPLVVVLLTWGLGLVLVHRAQNRALA